MTTTSATATRFRPVATRSSASGSSAASRRLACPGRRTRHRSRSRRDLRRSPRSRDARSSTASAAWAARAWSSPVRSGDLGRSDFNDAAQSLVVESGNWLACRDTWFRGDCRVFGPGRYDDLAAFGLDRAISSIRPAERPQAVLTAPSAPPPELARGAALEFYSEPQFGGERLLLERSIGALDRLDFDHRAASVVVLGGTWELCSDVRFSGSCAVYRPGRYPRMGELTRQVASVRRIQ